MTKNPSPAVATTLDDFLPEPLILVSADGTVVDGNRAARRRLPDLAQGLTLSSIMQGSAEQLETSLRLWSRSGDFIRGLVTLEAHDGELFTPYGARISGAGNDAPDLIIRCHKKRAANQRFTEITRRVHALNREVTRRQAVERQLHAEKELAQVTLQSIGDAVITTDTEGRVNYLNPVAETLTGWSEADARGVPLVDVFQIFNEHTRQPVESPVARVLAHGQIVGLANHTILLHRDGTEFAIDDSAAPIRDRSGHLIGVVLVFHDVTHERDLEAEVTHHASHDGLTGVLNRQAFEHQLSAILTPDNAAGAPHSLLFLDVDQFKVINDTCGHIAGDALLQLLAPTLQSQLRHSDLLARLGGDEFGILLKDCPVAVAQRIATSLRKAVMDFTFTWEDKPFGVSISIGQVDFVGHSWSLADLLSAADNACYLAKENGRNRVHLYRPDDQKMAYRFRQTQWVGRIREAFSADRFRLYGQAIRPVLQSARAEGAPPVGAHFELLLRLHDSDGRVVPPMAFIPAAERYNLMVSIDQWVLETAFAKLAESGCRRIATCTINLSGASLGSGEFLSFVKKCFERFAVPPAIICFEITETEAIANLANARHIIHALKSLGCRFALDDFGSGMSSFGYLKTLPVDYLKIDGSFIRNLATDSVDLAMVTAINNIGHVMGLETIAEFVESPQVFQQLRELGVDYVQGYGIARPQALDALLSSLEPE